MNLFPLHPGASEVVLRNLLPPRMKRRGTDSASVPAPPVTFAGPDRSRMTRTGAWFPEVGGTGGRRWPGFGSSFASRSAGSSAGRGLRKAGPRAGSPPTTRPRESGARSPWRVGVA